MRLLDLFCGAGGAAMGYHRAGFDEIVGVDIMPQKHYPFTFIQADALTFPLDGFDFIHASPVCKEYVYGLREVNKHMGRYHEHERLIPVMRQRLIESGKPWVLENVVGAPMHQGIMLCGTMFGLQVMRHRLFDSSHLLYPAGACNHTGQLFGIFGNNCWDYSERGKTYMTKKGPQTRPKVARRSLGAQAMRIDWMTYAELTQAIPPNYTEWLGRQLLAAIET